jgi:ATP/maltotriose-dependent transcriptional regulator MalT/DNA-binding SARP family transcriptional activator
MSIRESAKVSRPRLHGVVARDRLFAQIADSQCAVVWISGPPGAGKTTLAASYLQSIKSTVLWYQVDSGDADPATFFYFMREAAARVGISRLPLLPAEAVVDLPVFARRYFRELLGKLPRPATLVLDNFQEASASAFHTIIGEAFLQVPDGVTAIVASLSEPPPALTRLVANRLIGSIGGDELRFTRAEADQVVSTRFALDENVLAELHERSGGWAAGLVLMAEHMRRAESRELPALAESQEAVFDYFAGEILARAAPEDQRALMLSALLPYVTPRLMGAMSGHCDPDRLLDYLYRHHLFIDRRQEAEPTYRYHGLFRAFLHVRARAGLPAVELVEAAGRAALLLEVDGHVEDAITMQLAASDWQAASRLIVQHAYNLYRQGRWRTLLEWIAALPPQVTEAQPWLAYWVGACQVWVNPPVARRMLEQAFDRFAALGDATGNILAAGAITRACILDTHWTALDRWIGTLEALLAGETSALTARTRLTGYSRLLYAAFVRQPEHPRLAEWADRALMTLSADIEVSEAVLAGFSLLTYYTWTGQTARQEQVIRHVEPLVEDARSSPVSLAYWRWACATHELRTGAPMAALALIDKALELATSNGLTIAGVIRRHRIAHLLTLGCLDEAQREIDGLASAPRVEPYFEMRAWLALSRGQLTAARDEAQAALEMASERGRTVYRMLDLLLLAVICVESASYDRALAHARTYRALTSGVPGELAEFQASLVEAYIALQQRDDGTCHALLRRAFDIGARQRYHSHWAWYPPMMTRLLMEALAQGIGVAYARELIRIHRLRPESTDIDNWPWPVRIVSLGRFDVEIDGAPLRFEGKAQRKPLELLKVIIALGGTGVSTDKLIDVLWSETVSDGGQKAFDITLHRLRKLLGAEAAVEVSDRRATLNRHIVWVDAWSLDRTLEALVPASALLPAIELLESAAARILGLYGGHFLAGDADAPWQLALRNRLNGRFQRFVLRLGEHWESHREWHRAGDLYQRAVELDPLAESLYCRQMVCLQAQGHRAEALDVFRRCRQILSITLGVAPGRETECIYRELLAG